MICQSLLGACRVLGNIEMGKIAAEKFISVRPDEDPSSYALQSSMNIQSGKLEYGLVLWLMKHQSTKKEHGSCWVSINRRSYARDREHPWTDGIDCERFVLVSADVTGNLSPIFLDSMSLQVIYQSKYGGNNTALSLLDPKADKPLHTLQLRTSLNVSHRRYGCRLSCEFFWSFPPVAS